LKLAVFEPDAVPCSFALTNNGRGLVDVIHEISLLTTERRLRLRTGSGVHEHADYADLFVTPFQTMRWNR
jgi:hypothetical protein